jgi:hypothetical protein
MIMQLIDRKVATCPDSFADDESWELYVALRRSPHCTSVGGDITGHEAPNCVRITAPVLVAATISQAPSFISDDTTR